MGGHLEGEAPRPATPPHRHAQGAGQGGEAAVEVAVAQRGHGARHGHVARAGAAAWREAAGGGAEHVAAARAGEGGGEDGEARGGGGAGERHALAAAHHAGAEADRFALVENFNIFPVSKEEGHLDVIWIN